MWVYFICCSSCSYALYLYLMHTHYRASHTLVNVCYICSSCSRAFWTRLTLLLLNFSRRSSLSILRSWKTMGCSLSFLLLRWLMHLHRLVFFRRQLLLFHPHIISVHSPMVCWQGNPVFLRPLPGYFCLVAILLMFNILCPTRGQHKTGHSPNLNKPKIQNLEHSTGLEFNTCMVKAVKMTLTL